MASPDHAATVREASAELADAADGVLLTRADDLRAEIVETVDALLAALAQAEQERDEAISVREVEWRMSAKEINAAAIDRADRAERERDQAVEALREILMAEPDDPASPDGKTAWPSFAGRLQAIAGDVLANIEKEQA